MKTLRELVDFSKVEASTAAFSAKMVEGIQARLAQAKQASESAEHKRG